MTWMWNAMWLYSRLVWLNLLFVIGGLGVVTIPASAAMLRVAVAQLVSNSDTPDLREQFDTFKRHLRPGLAVVGPSVLVGVVGLGLVFGDVALLRGSGIALIGVALIAAAAAIASASCADAGSAAWGQRTVVALVTVPHRCAAAALTWLAAAGALLVLPAAGIVPVLAVAASGPAFLIEKFVLPGRPRRVARTGASPARNHPTPAASSIR
jgi:hypothetical protein